MKKIIRIFKILSKENKFHSISLILVKFISSVFELFGVASVFPFFKSIVDKEFLNENSYILLIKSYLVLEDQEVIYFLGVCSLVLILATQFIRLFSVYYERKVVHGIWFSTHLRIFKYYLHSPYIFHLINSTNRLQEKIQIQTNAAASGVIGPSLIIIGNFFTTIFIFALLLFVNFKITSITILVFLVYYFFINLGFKNKIKKLAEFSPIYSQQTFKLVDQALKSIKEIKIKNNYDFYIKKFGKLAKQYANNQTIFVIYSNIPRFFIESIFFILIFIFIFYAQSKDRSLDQFIPTVAIFVLALQKILPAIHSIYQQFTEIKLYSPSFQLIINELENSFKDDFKDESKNINKIDFNDSIQFKNVSFSYGSEKKFQIKIDNLEIKKNSFICITGKTGLGKTTFLDILIGLHSISNGEVIIDKQILNNDNLRNWYQLISYVPQMGFLADDTITRNIALGEEDKSIDFNKIKYCANIACIDNFIENELEQKYDTLVGENGIRLSGGQRQRICLARAFYNDTEILLLDESTNSLDTQTEERIINNILLNQNKKTIIMITHNKNLLLKSDSVIFIDENRQFIKDTYSNLVKNNNSFNELLLINEKNT